MKLKRYVAVALVLLGLTVGLSAGAYALSQFTKAVAGLGSMTWTDEVTITNVRVKSLSKVKVDLESNANTQALHIYTVYLYLDDVKWGVGLPTSWAAEDIPGVTNKLTFDGLNLAAISEVEAEVEE